VTLTGQQFRYVPRARVTVQLSMSDPHDTDPHRSELPRRLDVESPTRSGSMWLWLAALVAIVATLILAIGYAHILAILLDQVEGIENRFMRGLSFAQILKP
jgi:hypothetical protein